MKSTVVAEYLPVCRFCRHLMIEPGRPFCEAFPTRIPDEIWSGEDPHVKARRDQANNVVFAPRDGLDVRELVEDELLPPEALVRARPRA